MNEIDIFQDSSKGLIVDPGTIVFPEYQRIKDGAIKLSKEISNLEVTEVNAKTAKELVAAVRKEVVNLNTERIKIKKQMNQPYEEFAGQIKEIDNIVSDAEQIVRNQLKELEEQAREDKEKEIKELFERRVRLYDFSGMFNYKSFLKPRHLNKSTSLNKVEEEMVIWLENVNESINGIADLDHSTEILVEFQSTLDFVKAVNIVNERYQKISEVKKSSSINTKSAEIHYILEDEKDAKLLEMFMETQNIKYKKYEA